MSKSVFLVGCFLAAALPAVAQGPRLTANASIDPNGALSINVALNGPTPTNLIRADARTQYVARWEIVNPSGHLPPGLNRNPITRGSLSGRGTIEMHERVGTTTILLAPPPPPRTPSGMTARLTEVSYSFIKVTTNSPRLTAVVPNTLTVRF